MTVSTDGHLSYGIIFDEVFQFPWDADEFDGDIDDWWRNVKGYVNPIESPFDDVTGYYKDGLTGDSEIVRQFFAYESEWVKNNPLPIYLVNYCSGDYPMWLLTTKTWHCHRGSPTEIDFASLEDIEEAKVILLNFLNEFGIEYDKDPAWILSSYWG